MKKIPGKDIYFTKIKVMSGDTENNDLNMLFGLAPKLSELTKKCFFNIENAFGINLLTGDKYSFGKYSEYCKQKIKIGDEIGCYLNISNGSIWFTVNDIHQGIAFD